MAAQQKIHQAQLVSAAWRIIEPGRNTDVKTVLKRYQISRRQLKNAVVNLLEGNFKRDRNWNPIWDEEDVFHHPVDAVVMTDIENGSNKGSDIDLFMDPDFDALNGVCHFKWGMDEVVALCEGLPYRLLTIIRNSKKEDELYLEALEFMRSDFFNLICNAFGIDSESLLENALRCRAKPDRKSIKPVEAMFVDDSTGDFELMLADLGINGDSLLIEPETIN